MKSISKGLAILLGGALCLAVGQPAAADTDAPPVQHILQWRGAVLVGADGNGVTAAAFPTTVAGEDVHYVMFVDAGCPGNAQCPPPVASIQITLNDSVVFAAEDVDHERVEVALNAPQGDVNHIVITAAGQPGSAARVAVFALRPAAVAFGGRSILPLGFALERDRTLVTVHNAGPANMAFRLVFFYPDGTPAGHSAVRALADHATINLDLFQMAGQLGLNWTRGAVHVQWAAPGFSRMSSVANEVHREPDAAGMLQTTRSRTVPLDDYGPHMLNHADSQELLGY